MTQFSIPCTVYRGGTSRGLFFHKSDLPEQLEMQKNIFLAGIDAYNVSQVNGLGSGTSHTSKVVVIAPPSVEGADVNYTFVQVGIGKEMIDANGTCGNLMAAVGAFVIDEGLVQVDPLDDYAEVTVYDTNIGKMLKLQVPVLNGQAKVTGDYLMPGLAKPGAKIKVDIVNPGGGKTGLTMPLGTTYTLKTDSSTYELSFVDIVNPFVFVSSQALGVKGTEPNSEISANVSLMQEMDRIRDEMAVAAGMAGTLEQARLETPSVPKIAMVAEPQDYRTTSGRQIKAEEVDIIIKMVSMSLLHRTCSASGLYNIAAAALLPGTIPNLLARKKDSGKEHVMRIGHPDGIVELRVTLTEDGKDIASVGVDRTARRIMKGDLFIPH